MTQHLSEADVRGIAEYTRIGLDAEEVVADDGRPERHHRQPGAYHRVRPRRASSRRSIPSGGLSNVMRDDVDAPELHPGSGAGERAQAGRTASFLIPSILGGRGRSLMARTFGEMGIREIQTGLAAEGVLAPREVARRHASSASATADGAVHAFLETTEELALDAADRHRRSRRRRARFDELGPLAGVPVAFKDNMNLTGTHTTCSLAHAARTTCPPTRPPAWRRRMRGRRSSRSAS